MNSIASSVSKMTDTLTSTFTFVNACIKIIDLINGKLEKMNKNLTAIDKKLDVLAKELEKIKNIDK